MPSNSPQQCSSIQKLRLSDHFIVWLCLSLLCTSLWVLRNYGRVTVDQINTTLVLGVEGFDKQLYLRLAAWAIGIPSGITLLIFTKNVLHQKGWGRSSNFLNLCLLAFTSTLCWIITIDEPPKSTKNSLFNQYRPPSQIQASQPKYNLIWIFSESMEASYQDGTILKQIDQATNWMTTLNVDPLVNKNTIGGIMSARCGAPLFLPSIFSANSRIKSPFNRAICLDDIIKFNNYKSELIIGHDANFSGIREYFETHAHAKISDAAELAKAGYKLSTKQQIHDEDIFDYAKQELKSLRTKQPFSLTIVTLDNHSPTGYPSEKCQNNYGTRMANVLKCNSDGIAKFITHLKDTGTLENTALIITGDHLFMGNFPELLENPARKIFAKIYSPSNQKASRTLLTPFDLLPSALDAINTRTMGTRMGFGQSIYSKTPYPTQTWAQDLAYGFSSPPPSEYLDLHK